MLPLSVDILSSLRLSSNPPSSDDDAMLSVICNVSPDFNPIQCFNFRVVAETTREAQLAAADFRRSLLMRQQDDGTELSHALMNYGQQQQQQ